MTRQAPAWAVQRTGANPAGVDRYLVVDHRVEGAAAGPPPNLPPLPVAAHLTRSNAERETIYPAAWLQRIVALKCNKTRGRKDTTAAGVKGGPTGEPTQSRPAEGESAGPIPDTPPAATTQTQTQVKPHTTPEPPQDRTTNVHKHH